MIASLTKREAAFAALAAALLLAAVFGPAVAQPADYHDFADRRSLAGIPFALDVLTNLAFAAWGVAGLRVASQLSPSAHAAAARLFFAGLLATALGSAWYHAAPSDAGLLVDRLCMVLAFAGLLALAAAERVSERAGRAVAWGAGLLGFAAAATWGASGNAWPWALFQFGGMGLLLAGAALSPLSPSVPVRWAAIILLYALAKALELADHTVFELTRGTVSGHSLKHVVAACAAWPVLHALRIAGSVSSAACGARRDPARRANSEKEKHA